MSDSEAGWCDCPELTVHAIDVGWGSATALTTACDRVVIVDGGPRHPSDGSSISARWLRSAGYDKVAQLILTHVHKDHVDGFVEVAQHFSVAQAVLPYPLELLEFFFPYLPAPPIANSSPDSPEGQLEVLAAYRELVLALQEQETPISYTSSGGGFPFRIGANWIVERVYPTDLDALPQRSMVRAWSSKSEALDDAEIGRRSALFSELANYDSLVIQVRGAQSRPVVIGGDQVSPVWRDLADKNDWRDCVWILPHHGMPDGINAQNLRAVQPRYAVASIPAEWSALLRPYWDLQEKVGACEVISTTEVGATAREIALSGGLTLRVGGAPSTPPR